MLHHTQKYKDIGARLPKGILLSGKPGVGKTLLARTLAAESKCNFFMESASSFDEIFVGVGSDRIKKLFEMAQKNQPAIIFLDEFDSIGGRRDIHTKVTDPHSTLNQLLTYMDGWADQVQPERAHRGHRLDQLPGGAG